MNWNIIVTVILCAFIIAIAVSLILYMPRVLAWNTAFVKQKHLVAKKKNKIAVIVPARNESAVIGDFFASVEAQTYDHDYFDVHIIVKEDTDPTIKMAEDLGYIVHVCKAQTCKGDALELTLNEILSSTPDLYDQYLLVDADCVMEEHMIEELNNATASGRDIIQGKILVKNYFYGDSKKFITYASMCNGLIWPILNDMGNKYRNEHNLCQMLVGTGLMISAKVIKEIGGWPYRETFTEDMEFQMDSIVRGYAVYYTEYAKIYAEESTSMKMTNIRRTRWLSGVIDTCRLYNDRIDEKIKEDKTNRTAQSKFFGYSLNYSYWYIGLLLGLFVFSGITTISFALLGNPIWKLTLVTCITSLLVIYLSFLVLCIYTIIVDWKNIKVSPFRKIALMFTAPFFYFGYIPVIAKGLLGKKRKWDVVERISFTAVPGKKENK